MTITFMIESFRADLLDLLAVNRRLASLGVEGCKCNGWVALNLHHILSGLAGMTMQWKCISARGMLYMLYNCNANWKREHTRHGFRMIVIQCRH